MAKRFREPSWKQRLAASYLVLFFVLPLCWKLIHG